jgi:hypothetical protein
VFQQTVPSMHTLRVYSINSSHLSAGYQSMLCSILLVSAVAVSLALHAELLHAFIFLHNYGAAMLLASDMRKLHTLLTLATHV